MNNDEIIWNVLGENSCSFRVRTINDKLCKNQYNATGLCNKVSCPLANGMYATVIEDNGKYFLMLKTIERIAKPNKLWEKIPLSSSLEKAFKQIDIHTKNIYKDHVIHRCKQRLIKLNQMLIRMRAMQLEEDEIMVPINKKIEFREGCREKKAEIAAKLDISIENELLNRLKQGIYGDLYNYNTEVVNNILVERENTSQVKDIESVFDTDMCNAHYQYRDLSAINFEEDLSSMKQRDTDPDDFDSVESNILMKKNFLNRKSSIDKNNDNYISRKRTSKLKKKKAVRVEVEYEYLNDNDNVIHN